VAKARTAAHVENIERLKERVLALVGPKHVALLAAANRTNAAEFERLVRAAAPRGDDEGGHLVDTLETRQISPTAFEVSIGDEAGGAHDYPAHLEFGHRNADGVHVPGKPFWFPSKRIVSKRAHNRILRAERAAMKAVAARGSGSNG
jgi:hypothetical protein